MVPRFQAAARALLSIQGLSATEREAVVERLKLGRARAAAAHPEASPTASALTDRAFTWPEFDRWQEFFNSRGTFPARWDGLQTAPAAQTTPAARATYRLRKLDLLFEWLDALTHGAAAFGHYQRQGMRARVVRQGGEGPCPACESFHGHEVRHGDDPMPPFHPGCRCVLVAMSDTPTEERAPRRRRTP